MRRMQRRRIQRRWIQQRWLQRLRLRQGARAVGRVDGRVDGLLAYDNVEYAENRGWPPSAVVIVQSVFLNRWAPIFCAALQRATFSLVLRPAAGPRGRHTRRQSTGVSRFSPMVVDPVTGARALRDAPAP